MVYIKILLRVKLCQTTDKLGSSWVNLDMWLPSLKAVSVLGHLPSLDQSLCMADGILGPTESCAPHCSEEVAVIVCFTRVLRFTANKFCRV